MAESANLESATSSEIPLLSFTGIGNLRLAKPLVLRGGDRVAWVILSHTPREMLVSALALERETAPGQIRFLGQDLAQVSPTAQGLPQVLIVPRDGGLLANFNAWENIWIPFAYHNPKAMKDFPQRVRLMAEALGLSGNWMERRPTALSTWQRQAVSCIRALLLEPRLLVLDALFDEADGEEIGFGHSLIEHWPQLAPGLALLHLGAEPAAGLAFPALDWAHFME